jgi:hydroxypyruvate isomerase
MSYPQQSAAWWCFVPQFFTPEAFVRTLAELGYTGIDLVPQEYWQLVTDHGLRITAARGHSSLTQGLNRRELHDHLEVELRANLDLAQQWNIPNLICFSGNRAGLSDAEGAAATADGLLRVAGAAEAAGVTLLLELLNSRVDHPDYQADHTAWGVQVCQMANSPAVKLLYDIYHMQIMEGDIIRTLQAAAPWIGHYHTAGNPGRHEPDESQELNYPAIIRAIAATGFSGTICHEFVPAGEPLAALRAALALG